MTLEHDRLGSTRVNPCAFEQGHLSYTNDTIDVLRPVELVHQQDTDTRKKPSVQNIKGENKGYRKKLLRNAHGKANGTTNAGTERQTPGVKRF
jgi:hypothetical protein